MTKHASSAWVALAAVTTVGGCAPAIGLDQDHHVVSSGGGGAGGTAGGAGGSSAGGMGGMGGSTLTSSGSGGMGGTGGCGGASGVIGEPGAPCPVAGQLGCEHNASASTVICGSDGKWAANATCADGKFCDSAPGMDQGTCKKVLDACAGRCGGDVACDGQKRVKCGPDLVTSEELETCVDQTCVDGTCTGGCEDGQQNGDEADVDCGGSCPADCADGFLCLLATDCASGVCKDDGTGTLKCAVPQCGDGVVNGNELCDDGNMVNGDGCDDNCKPS